MHRLYTLNSICLKTLLTEKGYSPTYIRNNEWKYNFVLTNIIHKRRDSTLKKGWVVLNVQRLTEILGESKLAGKTFRFVDRIREDLYTWGIILYKYTINTNDENELRRKSLAKIKDEVIQFGWHLWKQLKITMSKEVETTNQGVYKQIKRSLALLRLDYKAAQQFCAEALAKRLKIKSKMEGWKLNDNRRVNREVHDSWTTSVDALYDAIKTPSTFRVRPEFEALQQGRAYHIMTSFPKILRQFVTLNGKKMIEVDISNSQPLLFGLYLKQNYAALTPDMLHYIQLVETGQFYNYLKGLLIHYQLKFNQDAFKAEFFGKVFYSREKKFHAWRCLFHLYFPGVSEAILKVKGATAMEVPGDPYKLTSQLSLLESQIMLQGVAKSLYDAKITEFITIHDAIYTTEEYLDVVVATVFEQYAKRGITPSIKVNK